MKKKYKGLHQGVTNDEMEGFKLEDIVTVTYDKGTHIPHGYDEPYDTLDEEKEEDEQ